MGNPEKGDLRQNNQKNDSARTERNPFWRDLLQELDFAFQPIIYMRTKELFGYEALLRNTEKFNLSIRDFFDKAYHEETLFDLEIALREKVIEKFCKIQKHTDQDLKLFINIDNRVLEMPNYEPGRTVSALKKNNLPQSAIVFEISEQQRFVSLKTAQEALVIYREQGYRIAVDDYGTGYSGLQVLYYAEPDIIKLDRFFISDISNNSRKRLFMSNIINLAHMLGSLVVAEGIENEEEFRTCLDLGCNLAQGYYIQRGETDLGRLAESYDLYHTPETSQSTGTLVSHDLADLLLPVKPIKSTFQMSEVFDLMHQQKEYSFFPVVNEHDEPIGVIFDRDMKPFLYSPYGRSLLSNKNVQNSLRKYIKKVPQAEYNQTVESIQKIFAEAKNENEVIIINLLGKYLGCLSSQSLLQAVSEQNLQQAKDLNPLTHLPGNQKIQQYLNAVFNNANDSFAIIYFDLNNFKAYNDRYGFERGDAIILLAAEKLRFYEDDRSFFIAHIGGDDFFMGVRNKTIEEAESIAAKIRDSFNGEVLHFFDDDDRNAGFFMARDRGHQQRKFEFTSLSAAVIYFQQGSAKDRQAFSRMVAEAKHQAKTAESHLHVTQW